MRAPDYPHKISRSNKRDKATMDSRDVASLAHHGELDQRAKEANRKPRCVITCSATGKRMLVETCRERQDLARSGKWRVIYEGCKDCARFEKATADAVEARRAGVKKGE